MVQNPVLFMTFARPEYARPSWEAIKTSKPKTLYFYSNKGRKEKEGEIERNNEIRDYITEIDWECDLHIWFREEYVDIYTSLLGAKNWAFENEETLIMLEEDTCASNAFFEFCDHFLKVYKNEKRIGFISGNNYANHYNYGNRDHIICNTIHHFGWATWKDRWKLVDWKIQPQTVTSLYTLYKYFGDLWLAIHYMLYYKDVTPFVEKTGCWDYVKIFNQIKMNQFAVVPIRNLVKNVGVEGTHTHQGKGPVFEMSNNEEYGKYCFTNVKQEILADVKFNIAESTSEGLRNIPLLKHKLLKKYWFTDIQDLRNKLMIGTKLRKLLSIVCRK